MFLALQPVVHSSSSDKNGNIYPHVCVTKFMKRCKLKTFFFCELIRVIRMSIEQTI